MAAIRKKKRSQYLEDAAQDQSKSCSNLALIRSVGVHPLFRGLRQVFGLLT